MYFAKTENLIDIKTALVALMSCII